MFYDLYLDVTYYINYSCNYYIPNSCVGAYCNLMAKRMKKSNLFMVNICSMFVITRKSTLSKEQTTFLGEPWWMLCNKPSFTEQYNFKINLSLLSNRLVKWWKSSNSAQPLLLNCLKSIKICLFPDMLYNMAKGGDFWCITTLKSLPDSVFRSGEREIVTEDRIIKAFLVRKSFTGRLENNGPTFRRLRTQRPK